MRYRRRVVTGDPPLLMQGTRKETGRGRTPRTPKILSVRSLRCIPAQAGGGCSILNFFYWTRGDSVVRHTTQYFFVRLRDAAFLRSGVTAPGEAYEMSRIHGTHTVNTPLCVCPVIRHAFSFCRPLIHEYSSDNARRVPENPQHVLASVRCRKAKCPLCSLNCRRMEAGRQWGRADT